MFTFFPALLRCNWHRMSYKFKLYNVICYTYIFQYAYNYVVVQLLSPVWLFATLWTQASLPFPSPGACSNSVHWISDAIRPSHPLSSPSPPLFNLSQSFLMSHIRWPKYWTFSFNISNSNEYSDRFPLGLTGLISLRSSWESKGLSRVFSNTIVQKHQFFGAQTSLWSNCHIHTWLLKKP